MNPGGATPDRGARAGVPAAILAAVAALALWLRLVGLDYGLPAVYNPDEVAIMNRAMAFATGDLNPHNFLYPSLYFYVLFAWEGLTFVLAWLTGRVESLGAFERLYFVDPTIVFVSGRLLSAIAGVITVIAVARLGSRLFGQRAGLLAALLLAVAPIAVRDAHYVKHDVPVTMLIVLTVAAAATLLVDRDRRAAPTAWLLAGALAGLAMSTHYYALFVTLPIGLAAVLGSRESPSAIARRLSLAGMAAVVAFFAASPFLLVEPATAWRDVVANREIVMDRAVAPAGLFASLGRYVSLLVLDGLGWPAAVAAIVGLFVAFGRDWRRALLLVAFPAAFLLFIANTVPASRYLNPILPFTAIAAAVAIAAIAARWQGVAGRVVAAALALAIAAPALTASVRAGTFFRQADTRTLALEHIARDVPPGSTMLVQPYSVPLRPSRASLVEGLRANLGSEDRATVKFRRQLDLDPYPEPSYRLIWLGTGGLDAEKIYVPLEAVTGAAPLAPLRAHGVEYVVLKYNAESTSLAPLRTALAREGRLVRTFSPYRDDEAGDRRDDVAPFLHNTDARIDAALARPGPVIELWHLR